MRPKEINETSPAFTYLQRPPRLITADVTVWGIVLPNCLHNRLCVKFLWTMFAIPASHRTIRSIQSFQHFFRGHGQDAKFSSWMGHVVKELGRGG